MKTCYFCKGPVVRQRIDYMTKSPEGYTLVKDLDAEVCTQCGEIFLDVAASESIDRAIESRGESNERLEVAVIRAISGVVK